MATAVVAPGSVICETCGEAMRPDEERKICIRCGEIVCSACWLLEQRGGAFVGIEANGRAITTPYRLHALCPDCESALQAEAEALAGYGDPDPHYDEIVDECIAGSEVDRMEREQDQLQVVAVRDRQGRRGVEIETESGVATLWGVDALRAVYEDLGLVLEREKAAAAGTVAART